jgi:hypothetical protein
MVHTLDGANTTAQWYQDSFLGTLFPHLEKFCLHTTETEGWPGYAGGASAPNATYHPRLREIRQHFSSDRSARALRDPSGTAVRENRDRVFQLEIVAYSDKQLGDSVGGLWIGDLTDSHYTDLANIILQLNRDLALPLRQSVTWKEGAVSAYGGVRLTGSAYDAYRGILGHVHVSGNTHWDPGGFRISRLIGKLAELSKPPPTEEDDVSAQDVWTYDIRNRVNSTDADASAILSGTHKDTWDTKQSVAELADRIDELDAKLDQVVALLQPPPV